jgi:septal ring factor EnvC (AmiA/AmiB activator)
MRRAVLALLAAAASIVSVRAEDAPPDEQLKAVEQQIDKAKKENITLDRKAHELSTEADRLQAQAVASAHLAQEYEARLNALDGELAKLAADEARQHAELDIKEAHERQVLAALQRLTINPPAAMAFAPGSPIDTARGAMLLGAAVPALATEAGTIADGLEQLRRTRGEIARRKTEMGERQAALDLERQRILDTVKQRQALETEARTQAAVTQQKLAALVAEAGDLKELLQRIERERVEEERKRASEAKARAELDAENKAREAREAAEIQRREAAGRPAIVAAAAPTAILPDPLDPHRQHPLLEPGKTQLQLPVAGTIAKRWGDPEGFSTSKGLTIATRPGAQIVAPFEGRIEFAGPFKGYGQILIIDHGGGYHSLLAGIDRIDGVVGQWVVTGEPLGTMQPDGKPSLYLELRRQGQPINPLPWLVARDGKASG